MPEPTDPRVMWMKGKTMLALEVGDDEWDTLLNEQYADKPKARASRHHLVTHARFHTPDTVGGRGGVGGKRERVSLRPHSRAPTDGWPEDALLSLRAV
jgi:hypothetical protein